jgi:predicted O-linked N-acetylglucosamine transferase (SPINDLY family)
MDIQQTLRSANSHRMAGNLAQAERLYQQILSQNPKNAEALHGLGMLMAQGGRIQQAVHLLRLAVDARPNSGEIQNDLGKLLIQIGQSDPAFECFKKAAQLSPDSAEAHNNYGNTLRERKKLTEAVASYDRAIQLMPEYAEAHYNLGTALMDQKKLEDAAASFKKALSIRPTLLEAQNNLGNAMIEMGKNEEALALYENLLRQKPDHAKALNNLGTALWKLGRLEDALAAINRAIRCKPDYHMAFNNRGVVLRELGRADLSLESFRQSLRLKPDYPEALTNLSRALRDAGLIPELLELCHDAIRHNPKYAEAHNALGGILEEMGQVDQALVACKRAVELAPDLAEAHNNIGNCYRDQGDLDKAIECYRRAIQLKPEVPSIGSNLAYSIHFHANYDSARIFQENRLWAEAHEIPLHKHHKPFDNDRSPDRPLRVGYYSPDFRVHCASCFLLPLLANHNGERARIHVYSGVRRSDAITERFRSFGHVWREVAHLSDDKIAEQIRQDKIDVLVDCTLHMADNRLLVFARKPAPVQVTWLGYPSTTGLSAIDYRLTDPYLDPPLTPSPGTPGEGWGEGLPYYSEKSFRLPHSFWCYQPMRPTADVNPLPALENGYITFGCLNNFVKVTPQTISLWSAVMREIPKSKLLILTQPGAHRERVKKSFADQGVSADRVDFISRVPLEEYFRLYNKLDVCLDTIPYPGHTTTLDALWMGVPAPTLTGNTAASRGGASILTNVGLPNLIANTTEDYVRIVKNLVDNQQELASLRGRLRQMMQDSPLTNGKQFASDMEDAFRLMWKTWCQTPESQSALA